MAISFYGFEFLSKKKKNSIWNNSKNIFKNMWLNTTYLHKYSIIMYALLIQKNMDNYNKFHSLI